MSRPWLPLYVGDYLADTGHLRAAEHGAYLMLIMHYWQRGSLPDDDRQLSAIARMSPIEWKRARPIIEPFFKAGWVHERIDRELADAKAAYERRANAGRKGGIAAHAADKSPSIASSNARPMPGALPEQSQSQLQNTEIVDHILVGDAPRKAKRAKARTAISEDAKPTVADCDAAKAVGFDKARMISEWMKFRDYHRAQGSLMADWSAAWRTWLRNHDRFNARAGPPNAGAYRNGLGAIAAEIFGHDGRQTESPGETPAGLPFDGDGRQGADGGDDRIVSRNAVELLIGNSVRRM